MARYYYKKLFEIKILHEYYLAKPDNSDFFALTDVERNQILNQKLSKNQYNIWNDIQIEPTDECQQLLNGYQIRFVKTPTGFFLGMESQMEGSTFFPLIKMEFVYTSVISGLFLINFPDQNKFFVNNLKNLCTFKQKRKR